MKIKLFKEFISLFLVGLVCSACVQQHKGNRVERWTEEQAQTWYEDQPWLVGCNYAPATAINQIEMWSKDTFDPQQIDKELTWAEDLGFNTLRVFLSSVVWKHDAEGLKQRMDQFLDICQKHGIRPFFVFFDDCWNRESHYGKQPEPVPGKHNSGWVQDPSYTARQDTATLFPWLQQYVEDIVTSFGHDERVLMWDLFNEPGNHGNDGQSLPLLRNVFRWARACQPIQPITAGVWSSDSQRTALHAVMLEQSDVITYHCYGDEARQMGYINFLKMHNRPLICTEYMARRSNSRFQNILPLLKKEKVGAVNWGLVAGKTNTMYAWDEVIPSGDEPKLWFHDIFRQDGTAFDEAEVDCIRQETGKISNSKHY